MSAAAVLIVSLDTKSAEARFLRERLLAEGIAVCLMDFGIRDDPVLLPEIAAAEVASRGGDDAVEVARGRQSGQRDRRDGERR